MASAPSLTGVTSYPARRRTTEVISRTDVSSSTTMTVPDRVVRLGHVGARAAAEAGASTRGK